MINVIIRDGNRTVNWDFPGSDTALEVLNRWHFEWEAESVSVCGMPIPEEMLNSTLDDLVYASTAMCMYAGKLFIDVKQPEKKKKEAT